MAAETRGNNNEEQPRRFNNGEAILRGDEDPQEVVDMLEPEVRAIAESFGFDEDGMYEVEIMEREAVINALKYGSQGDASKPVKVKFEFDKENQTLTIQVIDQGKGFNISERPDRRLPEHQFDDHGRGITFMEAWATVSNRMTDEGHVFEIKKKLTKKEPTQ